MRGRTNSISGITIKRNFATINITYPVGAICKATNGSKTVQAKDDSGTWNLSIATPKELPETWTITVDNGTKTKEQTVAITQEGQVVNVSISFKKYIFKAGIGFEDGYSALSITGFGPMGITGTQYLDVAPSSPGEVLAFQGDIGAETFSTVNMTLVQTSGSTGVIFALQTAPQTSIVIDDNQLAALKKAVVPVGSINTAYTLTISLSDIDTSQPLYLCSAHSGRPSRIYDVWLE